MPGTSFWDPSGPAGTSLSSQGQADTSHSPSTAAAEGETPAAKPGAVLNQHCSVLFQLALLALPSPPSTWQGSCTPSPRAGGAVPCASVPSCCPCSWPPSSACPAPATTSTTGKVGEGLCCPWWGSVAALSRHCRHGGHRSVQGPQKCSEPPAAARGWVFYSSSSNFGATCRELMLFSVVLKSTPSLGLQPSRVMDQAEKLLLRNRSRGLGG